MTGFGLSLLGAILFALGQVTLFAILYVVGAILSLVGTGFLLGCVARSPSLFRLLKRVERLKDGSRAGS